MKNLAIAAAVAAALGARNPRRIITRGVLDMATLEFDRSQEESFEYCGSMALADETDEEKLKKIETLFGKHIANVDEKLKEYEKQLKEKGGTIDEGLKTAIEKLNKDGGKIVSDMKAEQDKLRADLATQTAMVTELGQEVKNFQKERRGGAANERKSIGQQFIETQEIKDFLGTTPERARGRSPGVMFKNITSLPSSAGPGIFPEYLPTPVIPAFQPLTIRDLLAQGSTSSNIINWVQEQVFTNNAGYQGTDGNLKPQSDINYILQTIAVATVAHYFRISKQALGDFPMLRTLIDNRGTFGLKLAEEQQILFGDGAPTHLHGLVPQATAYNAALTKGTDTSLDIIRHAMLQTTLSFYPATGIALSPKDWHDIELLKDGFHRYLFSNPAGTIPAMVWGLPVAQCFSFGPGEFLVGSFKLAATIFDREEASILISTEDQDNVIRNLVTLLFEERLALGVSRPKAIISGDFPSGTSGPTG